MKTAKLTAMFLACAAAVPALAQNTTDSRCGMTNYDSRNNTFTIINPSSGTANQQCFFTVVPKASWPGGAPDLTSSQIVEGNYEVTLSGGGGGGGGGTERVGGGGGGAGAVPFTTVRYLQPGVYRLTIGAGGQGGAPNGGRGGDGAPTSLSDANSTQTVAGFPGAETWNGTYAQSYNVASAGRTYGQSDAQPGGSGGPAVENYGGRGGRVGREPNGQDGGRLTAVAFAGEPGKGGTDLAGDRLRHEVAGGGGGGAGFGNGGNGDSAAEDGKMKTGARAGGLGAGGGGGAGGEGVADTGAPGGNGFIKLALKDPVPQAPAQPAPAMSSSSDNATTPPRAADRPLRQDRN
jgi:hypothetical protein